jgi:hypothetical protein
MTKYRIHVVNEDGHVADRKDVSRANDQEARLAAKHEIKADGQAEVWDGERCVGQVSGSSEATERSHRLERGWE